MALHGEAVKAAAWPACRGGRGLTTLTPVTAAAAFSLLAPTPFSFLPAELVITATTYTARGKCPARPCPAPPHRAVRP